MGVCALGLAENIADIAQTGTRVDHLGRAQVMDFALAAADRNQCPTCGTTMLGDNATWRWTAPEVLYETDPVTDKSDIFAFAMTMVEVSHG